jgi:hypothetical protein
MGCSRLRIVSLYPVVQTGSKTRTKLETKIAEVRDATYQHYS